MTEGRDPKIVEREKQLFAGLMRTKTLPMVPDQTPSDIPVEPDDEELAGLEEGARRLQAHRALATSEGRLRLLRKQPKSTRKPTE